jgi:hypothetical protein
MTIKQLTRYLDTKGCDLKGCSSQEIAKLESFFRIKLPASYVEFLSAMGKRAGSFMRGSSVFYDEIFDLRQWSIDLLEDNDFKNLPDNTFVFWMHQGYQFAFFYTNSEDNPPVYYFSEGRTIGDFERTDDTFTDFLENQLIMSGLK